MKIKTLTIIVTIVSCYFFYQANAHSRSSIIDTSLNEVEALAAGESADDNTEKKFKFQIWQNDECYIYVGGAYAKGKKVSCYSGSDHPICVDCTL